MSTSYAKPALQDAILIEFTFQDVPPAAEAFKGVFAKLLGPSGSGIACQALEEQRATVYLRGLGPKADLAALKAGAQGIIGGVGDIEVSRLAAVNVLAGASAAKTPGYHYVVRTDVAAGGEAELERWYDEEHMAGLAAVPGVVLAQRLVSLDAGPRYYACYDLIAPEVLQSREWLAVRDTDWSSRVRPTFRNPRRIVSRRVLEMPA